MGIYQGAGIYSFDPITDPQQLAIAKARSKSFTEHLLKISHTMNTFGWDSQECRMARMDMAKWQRVERQGQHDQDAHTSNPAIKQQIPGRWGDQESDTRISAAKKDVGSMDLDHDEGSQAKWTAGWDRTPITDSDCDPVLPL